MTALTGDAGESQKATVTGAACYLREEILSGHFRPGDRIRQGLIAEHLGTSRLPVREALRILEVEGLVETETNKGARIPLLGAHDVDVLYHMREYLEPLALGESLPLMTAPTIERLAEIEAQIRQAQSVQEFIALDREFHLTTYNACRIAPLAATITRLWNATQHYRRTFMESAAPDRFGTANTEHGLLLDAILRHDADTAKLCLRMHIRRTRVALSRHTETFSTQ